MTKLWILSDLHLEALPYPEAFHLRPPDFDILVAAGDIWGDSVARSLKFLSRLARPHPVVSVMSNHEYWRSGLDRELVRARRLARKHGVVLLEGDTTDIGGVRFFGGTLWADGSLGSDESLLFNETGEPITIGTGWKARAMTREDAAARHHTLRRTLERQLEQPHDGLPVVVVTHHAPHPDCLPEGYLGIPALDASDLSHLTDTGLVDLWVHGHIHVSRDIARPGGTRIVCNPAGWGFDNPAFVDTLVIDVSGTGAV